MNSRLSTKNLALDKAANALEGFELDTMETTTQESKKETNGREALLSGMPRPKMDPFVSKIMLEKENRIKGLQEAAAASQQMMFMDWLATAEEDEANALLEDNEKGEISFYDEVALMQERWVDLNWVDTQQARTIIRQAFAIQCDLPRFNLDDLKAL